MGDMITIDADKKIEAYLTYPSLAPKGAIIVIHEVWGLNDHIKSVADRYAAEGYIALAPNLLSEIDFSSTDVQELQQALFDPERRSQVQPQLRELMSPISEPQFAVKTVDRLKACFNYLYDLPEANQRVAVSGFCFGGTYSFSLAVAEPRLLIALPFYGHADQPASDLAAIKCAISAFYGQADEALISKLDDLKQRMAEAGVDFEAQVYENCGHAFFNDTNPYAYNKTAAEDAWSKVLDKLSKFITP